MGAQETSLAKHAKNAKEPIALFGEAIDGNVDDRNAYFVFPRPFFCSWRSWREQLCVPKNRTGTSLCRCRQSMSIAHLAITASKQHTTLMRRCQHKALQYPDELATRLDRTPGRAAS